MAGQVVLCFASEYNQSLLDDGIWSVQAAGGLGVIVARSPSDYLYSYATHFPCVQVTYENMIEEKGKKDSNNLTTKIVNIKNIINILNLH